jgi:hypothetical protein
MSQSLYFPEELIWLQSTQLRHHPLQRCQLLGHSADQLVDLCENPQICYASTAAQPGGQPPSRARTSGKNYYLYN